MKYKDHDEQNKLTEQKNLLKGMGGGAADRWSSGVNESPDFNPLSSAEKSVLRCATFSVMTTTLGAHCAIDLRDWNPSIRKRRCSHFNYQLSIFNPLLFNVYLCDWKEDPQVAIHFDFWKSM